MTSTMREYVNAAQPNQLPDIFRVMKIGTVLLKGKKRTLRAQVPDANGVIVLPNEAKARVAVNGWARSATGGGTLGNLVAVAYGATPIDSQIGVNAAGNILVRAANIYTSVDVSYYPVDGEVVTVDIPVVAATNAATIPVGYTPLVQLCSCEAVQGLLLGTKTVLAPGAGVPAATQVRPNLALTTLTFAAADAVTVCRATFIKGLDFDLSSMLTASVP
jgi:hypothetical protein